jgi:arsenate reductase (thioredoxin)
LERWEFEIPRRGCDDPLGKVLLAYQLVSVYGYRAYPRLPAFLRLKGNSGMEKSSLTRVMFLCTGNACRSQMAEGFARKLGKGMIEPFSAGLIAAGVHPRAIAVMKEIDIDISGQKSKTVNEKLLLTMDIVVTLCNNAEEACPWTPSRIQRFYWPVRDPVNTIGTAEEVMQDFRRARDEIKAKLEAFIRILSYKRH